MPELAIFNIEDKKIAKTLGTLKYDAETYKFTCNDSESKLIEVFEKIYLDNTKFSDNEEIKKLGGHFEKKINKWCIQRQQLNKFTKFIDTYEKIYLSIPYILKDELKKKYNLSFESSSKKWFVKSNKMSEELEDFII
jgi:hypothetical protein